MSGQDVDWSGFPCTAEENEEDEEDELDEPMRALEARVTALEAAIAPTVPVLPLPPSSARKSHPVALRLTADEHRMVTVGAKEAGVTPSEWIRWAIIKQAREVDRLGREGAVGR